MSSSCPFTLLSYFIIEAELSYTLFFLFETPEVSWIALLNLFMFPRSMFFLSFSDLLSFSLFYNVLLVVPTQRVLVLVFFFFSSFVIKKNNFIYIDFVFIIRKNLAADWISFLSQFWRLEVWYWNQCQPLAGLWNLQGRILSCHFLQAALASSGLKRFSSHLCFHLHMITLPVCLCSYVAL